MNDEREGAAGEDPGAGGLVAGILAACCIFGSRACRGAVRHADDFARSTVRHADDLTGPAARQADGFQRPAGGAGEHAAEAGGELGSHSLQGQVLGRLGREATEGGLRAATSSDSREQSDGEENGN